MVAKMSTSSDRCLKKVSHAHYGGGVDNPNMGLIAQWTVWLIGRSDMVLYSVGADYICRYWDLLYKIIYNIFHLPTVTMYCM